MDVLTLILSLIALVIAILAYQKAGGIVDLKRQIEQIASSVDIKKPVDSLTAATETIREKTAGVIGKLETTVRGGGKKSPKGRTPKRPPKERETGKQI